MQGWSFYVLYMEEMELHFCETVLDERRTNESQENLKNISTNQDQLDSH